MSYYYLEGERGLNNRGKNNLINQQSIGRKDECLDYDEKTIFIIVE